MIIVGLGNPGEEYQNTRHNTGRDTVTAFAKKIGAEDFEFDKKSDALVATGKSGKTKVTFVLPETFMNKSGNAVGKFVKSVKAAKDLIIVHDDLDIPLGRIKMSFNKSSGGHKGVESVMRAVKTESFWRLRVGISPSTAGGKIKKPSSDSLVNNFIVAPWKPSEAAEMKKVIKKAVEALTLATTDGCERAMMEANRN
jgi:PTH1 family peptidyl-tRNA hydrolase